jgi:hypothetical protein
LTVPRAGLPCGSLPYAARATLSVADPEAQRTAWGKLIRSSCALLASPLGLALLSVRNLGHEATLTEGGTVAK